MLGIGLPVTFAGEIRSATRYLRYVDLIPLYATEWIILAIIGVAICGATGALDSAVRKLRGEADDNAVSRIAFAMIVAVSGILGGQIWINSFHGNALSLRELHVAVLVAMLGAGIGASLRRRSRILIRLASLARPIGLLGVVTLLPFTFIGGGSSSGPTTKLSNQGIEHPNIVLISIDALAADHLVPFGGSRPTSPNITALASQSIVFERFHAPSNFTTPSVATILTGMLPWQHRALQLPGRPDKMAVVDSLPARLHSSGYLTAYFASNPWAGARRQGFSAYFDSRHSVTEWETAPCFDAISSWLPFLCPASANALIGLTFKSAVRTGDALGLINSRQYADPAETVTAVQRWMVEPRKSPVFLWVHFLPPHDPYAAPPPWLGRFDSSSTATTVASSHPVYLFDSASDSPSRIRALEARYDESILYVDHYVGQLIESARTNLGPNTAIIITADHGESFAHHYGGHGGIMLYEDLLHIPLIIKLPGESTGGELRSDLADGADLAPTIAAIAQIKPSQNWSGISLLGDSSRSADRTIFGMSFEQSRSVGPLSMGAVTALRDNWKLIRFIGAPKYPNMPKLTTLLFDLASDPHEVNNVADAHQDVVTNLSAQIDEQLKGWGGALGAGTSHHP